MTITTEDVRLAASHETHLERQVTRPTGWGRYRGRIMDWITTGVVWIAALAAASGFGLLLEAIYDTVRWGHPR